MEIIDGNQPERNEQRSVIRSRNLFIGITLIAVGILWMLNNFDVLTDRIFDAIFSWQMLIVLIGGYLLSLRKWAAGGVTVALGACLAAIDWLHLCVPFNKIALPVILIAVGVSVILSYRK